MSYGYPPQQRQQQRQRRRSGGGFKMRLLIGLAIVLFSLFSFFSMRQENPITGEKQRVAIDTEEEIQMGLAAAPQMAAQFGNLHPNRAARNQVDEVGARLVQSLEDWVHRNNRTDPYRDAFDFHLLADMHTVNAFALPGGQIFITAALYRQLETEGQLAGVLGHEIGHVISRHAAQRMAKQKLTQGISGGVGVVGGGIESARMAQAVGQIISMKYGRADELESDVWGVRLAYGAGYDPRAMFQVMDVLERSMGGAGPPEIMSTHPKPANRKAYIKKVLKLEFPRGVPDGLTP
jgi:predicted Zn-dependent protease